MPVNHVEIDQVSEDESIPSTGPELLHLFHSLGIGHRGMRFTHAFSGKDVIDLADSDNRRAALLDRAQNCSRRFHREVMPASGSAEIALLANKRSRDDPANAVRITQAARYLADFIEALDRNDFLVRGNLQNRIG